MVGGAPKRLLGATADYCLTYMEWTDFSGTPRSEKSVLLPSSQQQQLLPSHRSIYLTLLLLAHTLSLQVETFRRAPDEVEASAAAGTPGKQRRPG